MYIGKPHEEGTWGRLWKISQEWTSRMKQGIIPRRDQMNKDIDFGMDGGWLADLAAGVICVEK